MARVLLIAPTCDGTDVGEAWVAYRWAKGLAERHDVTLLTYCKRDRTPAAAQLRGTTGVRVVEWREPPLLGRAERLNSIAKPAYLPFYLRARRWIRGAQRRGEVFDVAHQPVPVATRYPCPATGLGIPVIVGPVGGGLADPPGFADDAATDPWYMRLRALDAARLRHDPWLRRTYEQASLVVGIAPYVRERLSDLRLHDYADMAETALESLPGPGWGAPSPDPARTGALRLLFVGRLVRTKGPRHAIRALALVTDRATTLEIVGDGPDRAACEAEVVRLGLEGRVTFRGTLPHAEVEERYRAADVFVFPSYREPGGNVVFEAMGFGLPLVVTDRGGPAAVVDDSCGYRVPVSDAAALAREVAAAIDLLAADPRRRRAMGRAARDRVATVGLWSSKIAQMGAWYAKVGEQA